VLHNAIDFCKELFNLDAFDNHRVRSLLAGLTMHIVIFLSGQDYDAAPKKLAQAGQAVHRAAVSQHQIEQQDVGLLALCHLKRRGAIAGFAHDRPVRSALAQEAKARPQNLMIFHQHDSHDAPSLAIESWCTFSRLCICARPALRGINGRFDN
jgi:hypothetical protein